MLAQMKYEFKFSKSFYFIFTIQFILALLAFLTIKFISYPINYLIGVLLIILSASYSMKELNNRIGLMDLIEKIKIKFKNKS